MNRAAVAWLSIIVPIGIVVALCAYWEPLSYDSWGHYWWHREHQMTLPNLFDFARTSFDTNNPRLGQVVTLVLFTPGPWRVIATVILVVGLFYLVTTVIIGRWPSWRRGDDALVYVLVVALLASASPVFGPMLFYRPYLGNYTFGLVASFGLLVPYRLALAQVNHRGPRRSASWHVPAMLVFGFATGLCNEHTGPAIAALVALASVHAARVTRQWPRAWMIAGVIGVVGGGLALYFAPGQAIRYRGLATQGSLVARIASRGVGETAWMLVIPYVYALPIVIWIAIALLARNRHRGAPLPRSQTHMLAALALTSIAIELTLLASPKFGERLYFATQLFLVAATVGWIVPQLSARWSLRLTAGLAAGVLALGGWRCVRQYRSVAPEFAARLDVLEHAPPGSSVELAPYSSTPPRADARGYRRDAGTVLRWILDARWFIGDDVVEPYWRTRLGQLFACSIALVGDDAVEREVVDSRRER